MKVTQKGILIVVWLVMLALFLKYTPQIGVGLAIITLLVLLLGISGKLPKAVTPQKTQ